MIALIMALELRRKYNQMDFEDFIKEYEKFTNKKVPDKIKEDFKYTGLNNVDFLTIDFEQEYGGFVQKLNI
jgi:hypothetical protein